MLGLWGVALLCVPTCISHHAHHVLLSMLKIWELKKAEDERKAKGQKRVSAAQLRVQRDVNGLELPENMRVEFADPDDLMHFILRFEPTEGLYAGGHFSFEFSISQEYPIEPPKVRCLQKIFHPNINVEGALCLNILREDWKPVLSLNHIAMGIQFLFLEPNKNDPLNRDAAASLQSSPHLFAMEVQRSMMGHAVRGQVYDSVM